MQLSPAHQRKEHKEQTGEPCQRSHAHCLTFSKPHCQQFGSFDADEVGLTFIGNCLGKKGFSTSRWSIKENTFRRRHAKVLELLWMLHGDSLPEVKELV